MVAERVVVAMSGGVDSSVAAALVRGAGHEAIGVTLRVWERAGERGNACCGAEGAEDARRVAQRLGIPHYVLDVRDEFEREVVAPFDAAYRAGRTPVPCLGCNTALKFGSLMARARAWNATAVATGHYARAGLDPDTGRWTLRRGLDSAKDQSYFLWGLTQDQLARARFPIGSLTKAEVRATAAALGLATADKPESQEICFVPGGDYRAFLKARSPAGFEPGPVVDTRGAPIGTHPGVANFTVGQRRGLGAHGPRPLYVLALDARANTVTVGSRSELDQRRCVARDVNFVDGAWPTGALAVTARVRHGHAPAAAVVTPGADRRAQVVFAVAQRALTPGQPVVWYADDRVVGGGIIDD